MADSTSLETEIDVLMGEMKDWEQGMSYEWSEADRCSFLEKKRDTIKNFFLDEVAAWERKSQNKGSSTDESAAMEAQKQEDEAKARRDAQAAEEAAVEAEVRRQMEEEEAIRKRLAAEEAEIEAEVRRQIEEEENARKRAEDDRATQEAAEREAAARAAADAKEAAAKAAAAKEAPTIKEDAQAKPASPAVPVAQNFSDLEKELDAALEKELKEAQLRISRRPIGREADLTDPSVVATYIRIRNDRDELNWMLLGYPEGASPNKISVLASGSGGWAEMLPQIPHDPIFLYFNYKFGDTGRAKFVFMTYVPDNLPGMKKSRVVGHRPAVEKLLKYMQLSWHVLEYSDFSEETLQKKLLAAGGANYSVQEADKGNFGAYKNTTASFYSETEKKGNVGAVVYQTGPLTTTPMDISGRAMVAPPADFRANIVDLK